MFTATWKVGCWASHCANEKEKREEKDVTYLAFSKTVCASRYLNPTFKHPLSQRQQRFNCHLYCSILHCQSSNKHWKWVMRHFMLGRFAMMWWKDNLVSTILQKDIWIWNKNCNRCQYRSNLGHIQRTSWVTMCRLLLNCRFNKSFAMFSFCLWLLISVLDLGWHFITYNTI